METLSSKGPGQKSLCSLQIDMPLKCSVFTMLRIVHNRLQNLSQTCLFLGKVEELLEKLVGYFVVSLKRFLDFQILAGKLDNEGLKILGNVKTRWISMFRP